LDQCKAQGQKPIIAMEAYVVRDHKLKGKQEGEAENLNTREHLLLLAMNEQGYKNLMRLASIASTEGFYYRPRIDDELLKQYSDGLIATSACLGSRFSQMILRKDIKGCIEEVKKYMEMFQGRFFLEIQPTKEYLQKVVNHALIKISKKLNIPLVATSDAHYLLRKDSETHDVLLAMQSNDTLDNPLRWRFPGDTFFVATRKEMFDLFQEDCESEVDKIFLDKPEEEWKLDKDDVVFEKTITFKNKKTNQQETITKKYIKFKHNIDSDLINRAMDNAVVVADMCDVQVKFDKTYLPKVSMPQNEEFENWYQKKLEVEKQKNEKVDSKESYYLRYLCIKGLKEKGKTSKEYRDRLEYELDVITSMGFPDYFLLLEDVMSWCKKENIPVGPGRGCFKPNQLVTTKDGLKPIQDIKQGDMVLTHRKRFKEVKGIQKYQEEKEVAVVKFTHNGEQKKVECTKDHEFFIIPQHYGKDFKNVKWASAQELHKGDILLLPLSNEQAKKCSHKGHEGCLNCFGKKNKEWVEDYNRQYHETASNANRVVEKALNNLSVMVMDKEVEELLDSAKYSLEEMKELFGMNEVVQFEKENELFSEELREIGYEIAFVDDVLYEVYCGDVYDLTVEGDTSYTVNGVAVHNSAAGSLVSYAVGITNVDPIQYGLLFERFLNPTRGKLPKKYWASKVNLAKGCVA
jgi:DNA polymerase III alpha subunit